MEADESTLHTATAFLYRDACTQTSENNIVWRNRRDRVTQTLPWRCLVNKSTSVVRDQKVQTIFFPELTDKTLKPTVVKSCCPTREDSLPSSEENCNIEGAVAQSDRVRTFSNEDPSTSQDGEDSVDDELPATYRSDEFLIRNRKAPVTRGDFDLLYNLLDRWRVLEAGRASQGSLMPSKIASTNSILSREVRLLRAIDSFNSLASRKTRQSVHTKFLEELSRPVSWRNSRGERVLVVTDRVSRARDSKEIYRLLSKSDLSGDERSNLLGRVKELAMAHTCRHSRQLVRLLEQELKLLAAGFQGDWLNWLRDRTKIAFLQLARDSLQAAATQEEENLESRGRKRFCGICRRLLPIENFPESKGTGGGSSCNYCLYSIVRRGSRIVFEPYERLLRELRRTELGMGCRSKLAFAIGPKLIYHLVNDIWHGSSPISASNNLDGLRLVRLYRDVDWSPWNSLLLTKREANAHYAVEDLETFYGSTLLRKFRTRNLQAKLYFHGIL